MAALRLGVGDVFTVCKSVVDLCAKATTTNHEEMKDVRMLVAEMELMREHLSVVARKMDSKGASEEKDLAPLMTRSLGPIHHDLVNLHSTLQSHQHRKPSVHVLDQARYMLHYSDRLAAFKESLPRHRESISIMRAIFEEDTEDSIVAVDESNKLRGRTRRESILKLAGLVEQEEMRLEDEDYDQGWLKQESKAGGSIDSIVEVKSESHVELASSDGQPTTAIFPRPISPFAKIPTLQPFPGFTQGILFPKPTFRLDVFDSFSCTNTPTASPPVESADTAP